MASGQRFQSHGFQTSMDTARQQTTTLVGLKRPHDYGHHSVVNVHTAHQHGHQNVTPPSATHRPAIGKHADRSQTTTTDNSTSNKNGFLPRQRPVGFVPASAATHSRRITASAICGPALANPQPAPAAVAIASPAPAPAPALPQAPASPLLSLQHPRYGLPPALVANFKAVGIENVYPWQASCLLVRGHLTGEKNLLYSAPTGAGKSPVADVLMLKRIIENPARKAIIVLPYVALVQEKLKWLRRIVHDVEKNLADEPGAAAAKPWARLPKEIRVTGFFGGSKSRTTWADTDIAVCTIEKANSLVNTAIEDCTVDNLGIVVIDEIHMLDDNSRGYLLELMVTKLLLLQQDIQLIGMSATLSNTELLATWLHANYHASDHRPVPIEEHLVYENCIYQAANSKEFFQTAPKLDAVLLQASLVPYRQIDSSPFKELSNVTANAVVSLAVETAMAGYGALVFCGSRQACQTNAMLISETMPPPSTLDSEILEKRLDLLADLQSLPCGLDPVFQATVVKGVAFHHAGLTTEERELIADAYDRGIIKVIVATCSLAAGVNLPARRVIMQGARMGRDLVGPALLRQMRGRAGRKGKDIVGETYLICQKSDLEAVAELWDAETPAIESSLAQDNKGVKRALLEAIATRLVSGREAIEEYMSCTLLYRTSELAQLSKLTRDSLQELVDSELVYLREDDSYAPTKLGSAVVASSFSPDDGIFIYEELTRALEAFVMDGEMHIFYMFTPLTVAMNTTIDWVIFRDQLDGLDESGIRALQFVGVQPGFVNKMAQSGGSLREENSAQLQLTRIYRRAYTAFQLRDLSNEVPLSTIANRYGTSRGVIQTLAQTCHGFAAGMVKFCQRMGWGMLAVVLDHMRDRLQVGARDDLLEMAQVTFVKSWTARLLWENGFRSVRALAESDPQDIVPVLLMNRPRKTENYQNPEKEAERYAAKIRHKAEVIIASANKIYEREMQIEIDE
ncbi:putative DNA-directed DNA polymerase theta [Talaromyces proteolyticus]|uniref:DNA-directed DNA polymerase theta n=1 Tax=Talaromyces proteolyticus TaxID=1131652 RepID=A0AAD4Q2R2_9EURO|nr:putative DNA-directed DNA polymerase theta [Talaromyces proteolyticus]KAH8700613.1 putative DNA-directed DNA polymerase theta [Talaromyces proteolyticus]